jgi:hypothetical protein
MFFVLHMFIFGLRCSFINENLTISNYVNGTAIYVNQFGPDNQPFGIMFLTRWFWRMPVPLYEGLNGT